MLLDTIKELFTARYNIVHGKIEGCKKGSLVWHHENRHKKQYSKGLHCHIFTWAYLLSTVLGSILLAFGIVFKVFKLTLPAIGAVATPLLSLVIYFEIEAWVVAGYRKYQK